MLKSYRGVIQKAQFVKKAEVFFVFLYTLFASSLILMQFILVCISFICWDA